MPSTKEVIVGNPSAVSERLLEWKVSVSHYVPSYKGSRPLGSLDFMFLLKVETFDSQI